jgi:pyocin large subunit-like protein
MDSNVLVGSGIGVSVTAKVGVGCTVVTVVVSSGDGVMSMEGCVVQLVTSQNRLVTNKNLIRPLFDIGVRIAGMMALFKDK